MTRSAEASVVRNFSDRVQADRAVVKLGEAGFSPEQIRVEAMQHLCEDFNEAAAGTHADTGAFFGALAGAGLGGLAGIGLVSGMLPTLDLPRLTSTFATILTFAIVSMALSGLAGSLIGWAIRKQPGNYYEDRQERGGLVVTVHAAVQHEIALKIRNLSGGAKL